MRPFAGARIINDVVELHADAQQRPLLHRLDPQTAVVDQWIQPAPAVMLAVASRQAGHAKRLAP